MTDGYIKSYGMYGIDSVIVNILNQFLPNTVNMEFTQTRFIAANRFNNDWN